MLEEAFSRLRSSFHINEEFEVPRKYLPSGRIIEPVYTPPVCLVIAPYQGNGKVLATPPSQILALEQTVYPTYPTPANRASLPTSKRPSFAPASNQPCA